MLLVLVITIVVATLDCNVLVRAENVDGVLEFSHAPSSFRTERMCERGRARYYCHLLQVLFCLKGSSGKDFPNLPDNRGLKSSNKLFWNDSRKPENVRLWKFQNDCFCVLKSFKISCHQFYFKLLYNHFCQFGIHCLLTKEFTLLCMCKKLFYNLWPCVNTMAKLKKNTCAVINLMVKK